MVVTYGGVLEIRRGGYCCGSVGESLEGGYLDWGFVVGFRGITQKWRIRCKKLGGRKYSYIISF